MSNYKSCNLCNNRCEAGIMRNIPCDPTIKDKEDNVNKDKPMVPEDQNMVIWYQESRRSSERSN